MLLGAPCMDWKAVLMQLVVSCMQGGVLTGWCLCTVPGQEAMRVRPVAAIGVTRRTRREMCLGGYHIPKGTLVVVPFDAVHHHPDNWADPDAFIPVLVQQAPL